MDQWKAKREAVGDNKTCVQTQTDDINPSTDEMTQTEQLNSDAQAINIPTVLTKNRERSTQTRCTYTGGMQPTSKKPTDTEDTSKEWKSCTSVRSPYKGPAGNFSCFFNGFHSLDPHQLDQYSAGINLQIPS
jgi:hypothetical protein